MAVKLWKRPDAIKGNWYTTGTVTVWRDGRKCKVRIERKSTGTSDKGEAEAILLQIVAEYQRANIENKDTPPTIADLAIAYIEGRNVTRYLEPIIERLGHYDATQLTQAVVDKQGRLAYPGVAESTMRRQWHGPLISLCKYSHIHLPINRPRDSDAAIKFVTPTQADAIIFAATTSNRGTPWQGPLLEFMFGSGARMGETLLLKSSDLNMEYGTVTFRAETTKSGRTRTVQLPCRTIAALATLPNLEQPGALFRKSGGKAYTVRNDSGAKMAFISNAAKRAGVDIFHPHMARHSFATWRLDQTKDYLEVRVAGGWGSIKLLERYAHLAPGIGQQARNCGWEWKPRSAEPVQNIERDKNSTMIS